MKNGLSEHGFVFWKKKKETGMVEDDFTYNVDLTLFCKKKKFNRPIFINLNLEEPLNKKNRQNKISVLVSGWCDYQKWWCKWNGKSQWLSNYQIKWLL